ncbi:MAG: hypothetical protein ACW98X_25815 [Promethearchaeota archaeon]|jgi:hypothetical protein
MGVTVDAYFSPEPGNISTTLQEINGVIKINRENDDYLLRIFIIAYGTIQENITIFSNTYGREIIFDTSINSYTEEISLITPDNGQFIVYMVVDFIWYEHGSRLDNKTIYLAAGYQKIDYGIDLASIVIPGAFIICCAIGVAFIAILSRKSRSKPPDVTSINDKLDLINQSTKSYFSGGGEFKELDLSKVNSPPKPGEMSLLRLRKKKLNKMLKKLNPRLEELNSITNRLEEAREPVMNNHLFKFISSFFIRASRKRENYPQSENIVEKVQRIRTSLQDGRWDELQKEEHVKIAWQICDKYINTLPISKDLPFDIDFDVTKEIKILTDNIKEYNKVKKATIFPPDRSITINTKKDILAEIEVIELLFAKFKSYSKKNSRNYIRKCSNLKKETDQNLIWLKSNNDNIDDVNVVKRLSIRLENLEKLMNREIEFVKKLKSSS